MVTSLSTATMPTVLPSSSVIIALLARRIRLVESVLALSVISRSSPVPVAREIELKDGLEKALGIRLPRTIAFEHPTPAELAEHLVREHLHRGAGPPRTAVAGGDVEALLERELQKLEAMGVLSVG